MILYRPVGLQELALIYDSGMKSFPARLPQQPIFYPVLDLAYARQVASNWNAKNGELAGYITQFTVEDEYIDRFEKHTVGGSQHQELWIPAEEMEEFNRHIVGHIKVLEAHFGDAFEGFVPEQFGLQGKNAVEQFTLLANSYLYKRMDFYLEIKRNHKAVFLNYPFWQTYKFKNPGLKEKIIQAIKEAWLTSFPKNPLPLPPPAPEATPPVTETDLDSLVDSVEEDITAEEQSESRSLPTSVHENFKPVKQTYAQSLLSAADEESTLEEQIDSDSLVNLVHDDIKPVKQTHPYALTDPVDENIRLEEETDPDSWVKPVGEDIPPVKQTRTQAHFLGTPVHEHTAPVKQTGSHFVEGIKLGLREKYSEAIDELSQAVEEHPGHIIAHTSLGVAFHRVGEDDRALACYEAALKIDPRHAEAHYFRANILYSHGNARESIAGYTLAIGLNPELIEAHQAPAPQDRLTDYSPSPAEMRWIARSAQRILDLNKSLEMNAGQANLFKERAAHYFRLWNYEQAVADYTASLALQPEDASALHARGTAYEQMGQSERALKDYQQAIAINPQLWDVYIHRGITLGKMGNFRQSIASLTEGIRLAPENPDGYFNRGTSYLQLGDFERALEDFSTVIRLSPEDEGAYYWRGISNEEAGRQREAIADYRQFLKLSQDPHARQEIEQKLSQWNIGKPDHSSRDSVMPRDRQKTNQVPSKKPDPELDLYDLLATLGERVLHSTWFASGVDCYGEKAEELYASTDQNSPIEGRDFLSIASGIRQTIEGDFQAFDPGADSPWIFIRAWNGNGFYIETDDPGSKERLMAQFPSLEKVEGATPPYEGLFIRV